MPGPLLLDLIAAVIQGGAPPQSALGSIGRVLRAAGDPRGADLLRAASLLTRPSSEPAVEPATGASTGLRVMASVHEALALAASSGLPPTVLVRRAAAEERRRQASAQLRAIRKLEVLLVVPAGLCLLPAFVLLGIVPLVVQLITG